MKKLTRLFLIFMLAFAMFCSNASIGPFMSPAAAEVQAATKVKISKTKMSLYVNKTYTLKLKGTKKKAKWSSSNKAVATVNSKGKVTAKKAGTATIVAKVSGKKYKCKVTVVNPYLSQTSLSLITGQTATLTVTGATGAVNWSTSNQNVASVSGGSVQATGAGTATITAIASGVALTCNVTVTQPVNGVSLDQTFATLYIGETVTLKASVSPSNASNQGITWSSSNPSVATVDNGRVVAKNAGTVTITVTTADGNKTASATITVKKHVNNLTLAETSKTLKAGDKLDLNPVVSPSDATDVSYKVSSSDTSVATVDEKGIVTAVADGTAVITVTTNDKNISKTCNITVKTELVNISIENDAITLNKGETSKLTYTASPDIKTTASYTSDNTDVATVAEDGTITAKKSGTAQITVSVSDSYGNVKTATQTVTVITHAEAINLNADSTSLYIGGTCTITSTVTPDDTNNKHVTYSSSDETIATVSESGVVTAIGAGTATITATSQDNSNVTATIEITVKEVTASNNVTVTSQEELNTALQNTDLEVLTIKTEESVNIEIAEGSYPSVVLNIDAPKGHIENHAQFQVVNIKAVSTSTYVEYADNTINYTSESGSIEITTDATVSINVLAGASALNLENNGSVSALNITTADTDIKISGETSQLNMPVNVSASATGTALTTSSDLKITADSSVNLTVLSGGENTTVTVDTESSKPTVNGLGQISVTTQDTGSVESIVASGNGMVYTEKYDISGTVKDSDGSAITGAKVYILPYSSDITSDNIASSLTNENVITATTDENGTYTASDVTIGNYYIYIKEDTYTPVIETLILINQANGQGRNFVLVKDTAATGTVTGTLKDAQTGESADEGLTIYIRQGGNNTSGEYVAYTTTDSNGSFTFTEIPMGLYTIQVVDKRDDAEGYYVTTSYNVTVSSEETNAANSTVTKVLSSDQVRFVLTWGTEASGASSDLDSHLVGPVASGSGEFHTWFSDTTYSSNGTKCADLDVDDTSYEGPETTTIYVNTKGIYRFYILDYINEYDAGSDLLSKSSAVVKAYIGEKLIATYNCPNKPGNLWYVCDYNSSTNKFETKNIVSDFLEGSSNVGIDMLSKYQGLLSEALDEVKQILAENPEATVTGTTIAKAQDVLDNSTDYTEVKEQYEYLDSFLEYYTSGLWIDEVKATNADGVNFISNFYDDYDDEGNYYLNIEGTEETLTGDISFTVSDSSSYEIIDSTLDGYEKAVKVTNQYNLSRTYYISYQQYISLGIKNASAYASDDTDMENNLIHSYSVQNNTDVYVLNLEGTTADIPDTLTITPYADTIKVSDITDSDKSGYDKMVTLSYGDISRTYYISYSRYLEIGSVTEYADTDTAHENNLVDEWDTWYHWIVANNESKKINILYIAAPTKNYTITPALSGATVTVTDSDIANYEKMVTLTYGESSTTYYIDFCYYINLLNVSAYASDDTDHENSLISDWYTSWDDDDNRVLELTGNTESIPDTLIIKTTADTQVISVTDSDIDAYSKMIVIPWGDTTRTYYIDYIADASDDSDDSTEDTEPTTEETTETAATTEITNETTEAEDNQDTTESTDETEAAPEETENVTSDNGTDSSMLSTEETE